jgi:glycosyltransferase involved in cell wall biosynthesis
MIAAFFHDHPFTRDASGAWYSSGAVPYAALARYLPHFEGIVVVARIACPSEAPNARRTLASGPGVAWACLDPEDLGAARWLPAVSRHVRGVLARVDCAVVRLPGLIGPVACREALRAGKPFLVEVVGDAFDSLWHHGSWLGKAAALPVALVNRVAIRRAPFAIYVTREALQRRYPSSGLSVGVSDVIVEPPRAEVLARRLARIEGLARGAPIALGLVGSYDVDYKGHADALHAAAILRRAGRPVSLRCIGAGDPERWRARAAALGIADCVTLDPPLPHAAVPAWLDALDVALVPSRTEGLPRALVEAMSRALPAVGARTGGIPELLDANALHRPRDPHSLALVVAGLLDRPEALAAQARRNWQVAGGYAAGVLEARRDALVRQFRDAVAARAGGAAPRRAAGA